MGSYKGFNQVELKRPQRSMFDLSHEKRLSTRIGKLTPVFISETMPNDTFKVSTEVLIKLAPLIAPIFHRLNLYVHFFFVPNRLLWEDWEDFITGGRLGEAVSVPPVPPYFQVQSILDQLNEYLAVGRPSDYLGVPPIADAAAGWGAAQRLDMMPFAAFYKCWYDYYRDRNFTADDELLPMPSGDLTLSTSPTEYYTAFFEHKYRAWQHEYFSSSLPFTQRGTEVLMPLQGSGVPVYDDQSQVFRSDGAANTGGPISSLALVGPNLVADDGGGFDAIRIENIDSVLINASSVSINDLRRAVALQTWLERNALAGSRYNESIMAHFGRKTSDARLQRAEYLGGGKAVVQISEIMTTSYSEDGASELVPPGNPTGRGSAYSTTNSFKYNCEEHGFVVGILSVMPTAAYMQGIPRMFTSRRQFLDYPWPTFAHLGEQEVWENEVYMNSANMVHGGSTYSLFGYQSRYCDWKSIPSSSHGDFRTTLDYWHLSRKFAGPGAPPLNEAFVTFEDELQDRIFNVSGVDTVWMYIYNKCSVVRALPYFGTPMLK